VNLKRKATNRRLAIAPPPDADDDDDRDELLEGADSAADLDLDEQLRELDAELGDDAAAKVVVHKVIANGDSQRCFSCPRSQFFSDKIREDWGAGTYSVLVYVNSRIRKRARITFAEPLARLTPIAATPASSSTFDASTALRALEARLDAEAARNFELMKLLAGGARPPAVDPLQVQQQMLTMLSTVKELTAPASSSTDRGSVEVFLEGMKMAQKFAAGGAGESTDWSGIALGVVEGMRALAQSQPAARPVVRALPAPSITDTTPASSPASDSGEGDTDMFAKLKEQLQFLVKKAAAGSDPELYADLVVDNLGDLNPMMQSLAVEYLKADDCLERLGAQEPGVLVHREWFARCLEEIRRVLSAQSAAPSLTGGGSASEPESE
jgi:hypothetical protein